VWSLIVVRRRPASGATPCYRLLISVATGMAILVAALSLVSFPVRADIVAQVQRLVEPAYSAQQRTG